MIGDGQYERAGILRDSFVFVLIAMRCRDIAQSAVDRCCAFLWQMVGRRIPLFVDSDWAEQLFFGRVLRSPKQTSGVQRGGEYSWSAHNRRCHGIALQTSCRE